MGFTPKSRRAVCLAIVPLIVAAWIAVSLRTGRTVQAAPTGRTVSLGAARGGEMYAVTVSVKDPSQLQGSDAVHATISDAQGEIESKWLHPADLDFYLTVRPRGDGPVTVNLSPASDAHLPEVTTSMRAIPGLADTTIASRAH